MLQPHESRFLDHITARSKLASVAHPLPREPWWLHQAVYSSTRLPMCSPHIPASPPYAELRSCIIPTVVWGLPSLSLLISSPLPFFRRIKGTHLFGDSSQLKRIEEAETTAMQYNVLILAQLLECGALLDTNRFGKEGGRREWKLLKHLSHE